MLLWLVKPHLGQIVPPAQEPSIVENTHQVMAAKGLGSSRFCLRQLQRRNFRKLPQVQLRPYIEQSGHLIERICLGTALRPSPSAGKGAARRKKYRKTQKEKICQKASLPKLICEFHHLMQNWKRHEKNQVPSSLPASYCAMLPVVAAPAQLT